MTGGHFVFQSSFEITDADETIVIDFKNASALGRFHHYISDTAGSVVAKANGGIESDAQNPFFKIIAVTIHHMHLNGFKKAEVSYGSAYMQEVTSLDEFRMLADKRMFDLLTALKDGDSWLSPSRFLLRSPLPLVMAPQDLHKLHRVNLPQALR
ncbi:hypothetical protein [Vreelandella boliviensis]|uniref:Uncharacterized protein n=1 Tax=Vreelandella boliviensis LC1 TaxID=1072583 RepID=A0A265E1Y8_9GAMM|nr:hypothetical protein [Halomonas boliviensis]EHJ94576.1 hypothetical protein KUC_1535 [Halomonas boliviensis LC1]OZT75577.1 hypothetical protein CE457_04075 [Halomonas boliviensis LC1]